MMDSIEKYTSSLAKNISNCCPNATNDREEVSIKLISTNKKKSSGNEDAGREIEPYAIKRYRRFLSYSNTRFNYHGDLELWVWDTTFQVHANILRECSSYFRELLHDHWCGIPNSSNVQYMMVISDSAITPTNFKIVLDYLYFGKLCVTLDSIEEAYLAIEFLDIEVEDEDVVTDLSLSGIHMNLTGEERNTILYETSATDSDSGKQSTDREGASSVEDDASSEMNNPTTEIGFDSDNGEDSAISVETPRTRTGKDLLDSGSFYSDMTMDGIHDDFLSLEEAKSDDLTLMGDMTNLSDDELSVGTIPSEELVQLDYTEKRVSDDDSVTRSVSNRRTPSMILETQSIAIQTDDIEYENTMNNNSWHSRDRLTPISLADSLERENGYDTAMQITKTELLQLKSSSNFLSNTYSRSTDSLPIFDYDESEDEYELAFDEQVVIERGDLASARFDGKEDCFAQLVRFLQVDYQVGGKGGSRPSSRPSSRCSSRCSNRSGRRRRFNIFGFDDSEYGSLYSEEMTLECRDSKSVDHRTSTANKDTAVLAEEKEKILEEFCQFLWTEYDNVLEEGEDKIEEPSQNMDHNLALSAVFIHDRGPVLFSYDISDQKWKEFNRDSGIWRLPGSRWFSNDKTVYCLRYHERSPVFQRRLLAYNCKKGEWEKSIPSFITTSSLSVLGMVADSEDRIYVLEGGVTDFFLTVHHYDPNISPSSWDIKLVPLEQLSTITMQDRMGIESDLIQFKDSCICRGRIYFLYIKYRDPDIYLGYLQPPKSKEGQWNAREVMKISAHYLNELWLLISDGENLFALLIHSRRIVLMKILPETGSLLHVAGLSEQSDIFPLVKLTEGKKWSTTATLVNDHVNICNFPSSLNMCRYDLEANEWSCVPLPAQSHRNRWDSVSMLSLDLSTLPEVFASTERIRNDALGGGMWLYSGTH